MSLQAVKSIVGSYVK